MIAKVNALRELQSQTGEELDALLPSHKGMISVLDRAFKEGVVKTAPFPARFCFSLFLGSFSGGWN
jgi:hypothetical protein